MAKLRGIGAQFVRGADEADAVLEITRLRLANVLESIEPVHALWSVTKPIEGDHREFHTRPSRYGAVQGMYDAGVDLHLEDEFSGDPSTTAFGGARRWPKLIIEVRLPSDISNERQRRFIWIWKTMVDRFLSEEGLDK